MRSWGGVVAGVAAALVLSACSGHEPTPKGYHPLTAHRLVTDVQDAVASAGSVSYKVDNGTTKSWGWSETGEGTQQEAFGQGVPVENTDGTVTTPSGPTLLRTKDVACTTSADAIPKGKKRTWWCSYDSRIFDWIVSPRLNSTNPLTWLAAITGPTAHKRVGSATIDGVRTEHFTLRADLGSDVAPEVGVDLWLDTQHRPVRMEIDDAFNTGSTARYRADFSGFGGTKTLEAPPYNQMYDWVAMQKMSQGPMTRYCMMADCSDIKIRRPDRTP